MVVDKRGQCVTTPYIRGHGSADGGPGIAATDGDGNNGETYAQNILQFWPKLLNYLKC